MYNADITLSYLKKVFGVFQYCYNIDNKKYVQNRKKTELAI